MITWTDERVALLAKLRAKGLSASKIAFELGGGVTRNAVIGKLSRLGDGGLRAAAAAELRVAAPVEPPVLVEALAPEPPPPPAVPAEHRRPETPADPAPVTILDLRDAMCRWPIGDPRSSDFRFCGRPRCAAVLAYPGAKRAMASSYCTDHHAAAHTASVPRRPATGITAAA